LLDLSVEKENQKHPHQKHPHQHRNPNPEFTEGKGKETHRLTLGLAGKDAPPKAALFLSIQRASASRDTGRRTRAAEGHASTTAERERPPSGAECVAAVHCRGVSPAWPQQKPPAADLLCQYRAATGGKEDKSERGREGKRGRGVPWSLAECCRRRKRHRGARPPSSRHERDSQNGGEK
jgi:hypothetical protein